MKAILRLCLSIILNTIFLFFLNAQTQVDNDIDGEAAGDESGYSVSMSSDGSRVAIGAPYNDGNGSNSGHVRIYEESGGSWTQVGSDIDGEAVNDQSGWSVSISSDGTRVAIGARYDDGNGSNSGHVRIYEESGGTWIQVGSDIDGEGSSDQFGYSVSISSDGTRVAIGALKNDGNGIDSGHVRIYEESGGTWTQVGSDIDGEDENDLSGWSVSLSSDGVRVAIGAPYNDGNGSRSGHVRIYEESGGTWTQVGSDIDGEAADDDSGISVSLSSDGSRVAIGAPENDGNGNLSGHVRIYEESGGSWTQVGSDIDGEAALDRFGDSVSLSSDGSRVAIGAWGNDGNGNNSGHVRIYEESAGNWTQVGNDIDGEDENDSSGRSSSVSLSSDGSRVAIGAHGNDGNGSNSGHVRVYEGLDGPLPLELKSFSAQKTDQIVHLSWHTTSETNNTGFELQHSINGLSWDKLDFIESKGNTDTGNEYDYLHRDPVPGINYYRLKMIDLDGSYEYSNIVSVQFDQLDQIRIFPNPTSGIVNIQGIESGKVTIFNSIGRLVKTMPLVDQKIDLRDLPNGLYYCSVRSGSQVFSEKIMKR